LELVEIRILLVGIKMRNLPRQKLHELVTTYGQKLSENSKLCRALLNDLCPGHKLEINLILVALEEQIANRLLSWQSNSPIEILLSQLTKRLEEDRGFKPDVALWTVETWALALGKIPVNYLQISSLGNSTPSNNPLPNLSQEIVEPVLDKEKNLNPSNNEQKRAVVSNKERSNEEQNLNSSEIELNHGQPKINPIVYKFTTVNLDIAGKITQQTKEAKQFFESLSNKVFLEMVEIPAGEIFIGSPLTEIGRLDNETPQHHVRLSKFYISKYLITQHQWQTVMGNNPSYFKGDNLPVEQVSWHQAVEFCQRLSVKTSKNYRLPSEAEWEYAARAGTSTPFAFGEIINPKLVNYDSLYPYSSTISKTVGLNRTSVVGVYGIINSFGLHDMHGNVWEWCLDAYQNNYLNAPVNGTAKEQTEGQVRRVLRGGAWISPAKSCRSASRSKAVPEETSNIIGFRVTVIT
jgi:formylglycine-generating enzyme required for sulfatase activity